ncbi:GntR family transcriptional regulator [Klebsiella oxytoca]|uniref:GntR family transcriptional regulator n=1 Tax=Klebsiella oxytoca TaxID=571 RepID=UPI00157A9796|nr:GntR family transcriptional regulator [Klebsiella oxytoca]
MRRYIEIANVIRERILNKIYIQGAKIPFGHQLCHEFSCSKITLNNALDILVNEGFITRQRGLGTVVKTATPPQAFAAGHSASPIMGLSTFHRAQGGCVSSHLLEFGIANPPEEIAGQLAMQGEQYAWHFRRVRFVDTQALSIEETWIPLRILPDLTRLDALGSIYQYVETRLHKVPTSSHTWFYSLPSDDEAQEWLKLQPHEPVSVTRSVTYLNDGQPLEYCTSRYHYQRFNYNAVVQHHDN